MNRIKSIWKATSYGQISIVLFLVCVVSGIFLAIPFDINKAYESVSLMMIANPAAALFRNLHYWSAQIFLVFSLLHIYDHFGKETGIKLKSGLWARLSIGVFVIFLAMLTGFLLKGDADSRQAHQILDSLISGIPLIGSFLSYSLLGASENLQLVYIHHVATFTLFLTIIIIEHHRKFWPRWAEFVFITFFLLILSYFIPTPLHDNVNPTVKGPWYFVGLQEILHWLKHPGWSLLIILGVITLVYVIPFSSDKWAFISKRSLLILTFAYLLLTITGSYFRGPDWKWTWPWQNDYAYLTQTKIAFSPLTFFPQFNESKISISPVIDGHKESCLVCHDQMEGFTLSHNPQVIGCFSCHGGHPFEADKDRSHKDMLTIPGNLSDASRSCGTSNCHFEITERINTSLMSTLSGMISVDRFVFDEQNTPDLITDIHHLGNSAADEHLKNLCVRCHLGNLKTETGPIDEKSRGGGCLACHLNYDATTTAAVYEKNWNETDSTFLQYHPSVSLNVTNEHCFGCHSRSARISTNYEGWHETTLDLDEMPDNREYILVEGTRVFNYVEEDIHHKAGLSCIDCHNSYELMGDGNLYPHQENQVTIRCTDCHANTDRKTVKSNELDRESAIISSLRFGDVSKRNFLKTENRNHPLINTWIENDTAYLKGKISGKTHIMNPPAAACQAGKAHQSLSCSSCHTSWAPSCIGCHNEYDTEEPGYNMLTNKEQKGSWVEYTGAFNAHKPALGTRTINNHKEVITVIPGMVLSINARGYTQNREDSVIFKRLFAPTEAHTTRKQGRDCKSCHNNPVALGFGEGNLEYVVDGKLGRWKFTPKYQSNRYDNLPEDAWTGFLLDRNDAVSTRTGVKPFTLTEQKNILTAGACLTCHEKDTPVMIESLEDFDKLLTRVGDRCILPSW